MSNDLPWTIGRLLEWTAGYLEGKVPGPDGGRLSREAARLEAQLLLAQALKCTRTALYTRFNEEPNEADRTKFRELVQRRVKGAPVAHLLGKKEFFSLEFEVGPSVLIPRADTEWLVTECLTLAKTIPDVRILDVGTGSGCISVALAHQHKTASVTAVDIYPDALEIAKRNAEKHKVTSRIRFLQGDLFEPIPPGERFHFIVSNPPYIPTADIAGLASEVRDNEPHSALDGGETGFAVIDRLIASAPEYLEPGGHLLIEIGYNQEAEARKRFEHAGVWELGKTIHDGGGHPRVLVAKWTGTPT